LAEAIANEQPFGDAAGQFAASQKRQLTVSPAGCQHLSMNNLHGERINCLDTGFCQTNGRPPQNPDEVAVKL
jgi:hypothetical protein